MSVRSHEELKPKLAIVSEQPDLRRRILTLLGAHGWDIRSYESAAGVLNDPRTLSVGLLIASEKLPDLSAPALAIALRAKGWGGKAILICPCAEAGVVPCPPSTDFAALFDPSDANHLLVELVEAQF